MRRCAQPSARPGGRLDHEDVLYAPRLCDAGRKQDLAEYVAGSGHEIPEQIQGSMRQRIGGIARGDQTGQRAHAGKQQVQQADVVHEGEHGPCRGQRELGQDVELDRHPRCGAADDRVRGGAVGGTWCLARRLFLDGFFAHAAVSVQRSSPLPVSVAPRADMNRPRGERLFSSAPRGENPVHDPSGYART